MFKRLYGGLQKLWYAYLINKDKRRGVDYYTVVENAETRVAGHYRYQATSFLYDRILREFLRRQDHAGDCIIDVGCGKGRMLELFNALGFLKSDGLEYSLELSEIARKNMKTLGLPCEVFTGDAAQFDGYDAYNWFYLFNPFGKDIMLRLIGKLKESLQHDPRRITILYTNPQFESVFADAGFHMGWIGTGKHRIRLITNEGTAEDVSEAARAMPLHGAF